MAASRVGVGFIAFLLAFLLRGQGEGSKGFAIVIAAAGLGGFLGSALAPVLRVVMRESVLLVASLAALIGAALWPAGAFDVVRAAVVAAVVGAASGVGRLAFDSLLQGDAPSEVRGRTFARYETIFQLCWVGGAGLATAVPFASRGGMRTLAAIAGTGIVLALRGRCGAGRSHAGMAISEPPPKAADRHAVKGLSTGAQAKNGEQEDVEFSNDSGAPRPR